MKRTGRKSIIGGIVATIGCVFPSLVIIMICGFFVGMVLSLQAINALQMFGASDQVSMLVGKTLFRELGPVLTALLFAGRAGTSIAAELGLMKATSQIEAMQLMAIDPVKRIALPRFLAGLISMPLLAAMFSAFAVLGSVIFSIGVMGLDPGIFWSKLQSSIQFDKDFMGGMFDFDGNGKTTLYEQYVAYKIYEKTTKEENNFSSSYHKPAKYSYTNNNSTNSKGTKGGTIIAVVAVIISLFLLFAKCSSTKRVLDEHLLF